MRHDPIELGLPSAAAARRERSRRRQLPHHEQKSPEALRGAHALRAIDEAFATLAENIERVQRLNLGGDPGEAADHGIPRASRSDMGMTSETSRPIAEPGATGVRQAGHERVLANLAAQLSELDRQREQLAQLLHQVSVIGSAD